jgi:ribonuclease P protein component
MKGKQYITRSEDFDRVYHQNAAWASGLVVIRIAPNGLVLSRYGCSINKRVGKAVLRNLIRRRLREIMRQVTLKPGWDIVLIIRPAVARVGYAALKKSVEGLLLQARLLVRKNEIHHVNPN